MPNSPSHSATAGMHAAGIPTQPPRSGSMKPLGTGTGIPDLNPMYPAFPPSSPPIVTGPPGGIIRAE